MMIAADPSNSQLKAAEAKGRREMAEAVRNLWDAENGWIPGAAIDRLSEVLDLELKTSQELRG